MNFKMSKTQFIMNPIALILRSAENTLTAEEDAALTRELTKAYHMDELASKSRDVERIAEKVRLRLGDLSIVVSHSHNQSP